jgi:hypothetical protein
MKTRNALLLGALALLLLGSAAAAQSGGPVRYAVEPGTASGGDYQLTGRDGSPGVEMRGGDYRLLGGLQPQLTGSGCCCLYLPCIRKP